MNNEDDLYPIAVLLEELKHEDCATRLGAIRHLSTIAIALGPERTRTELIQFLTEESDREEDEILLALAEELMNFVPLVGGPEFAHTLLPPLGNLAGQEESIVRNASIISLVHICEQMSDADVTTHFVPLIESLVSDEYYTPRTTASGLFECVYARVAPELQAQLRRLFSRLLSDSFVVPRRDAATNLKTLIRLFAEEHLVSDGVSMFRTIATDDQDSVRLLAVPVAVSIIEKVASAEAALAVATHTRNLVKDKSWRVRYMAAENIAELGTALKAKQQLEHLSDALSLLVSDDEAEVRTAAAAKLPAYARLLSHEEAVAYISSSIGSLSVDQSQQVRASLAAEVGSLAPILGKEGTEQYLIPIIQTLLSDTFSDVRLNVIRTLDEVNSVVGIGLIASHLLPAIIDLAADKKWRVRKEIIKCIPQIADHVGVEYFNENLCHFCLAWLGDPVYAIRQVATVNFGELTRVFGVDWAIRTILPEVLSLGTHTNYLYRMTALSAINVLAPLVGAEITLSTILPVVVDLCSDVVPNIRFNAVQSLGILVSSLPAEVRAEAQHGPLDQVRALLNEMANDADNDVQFFTQKTLALF